jgi:hypothetical protein
MTDHSWFRLLVRAIGLLLFGIAIPGLLWNIGGVIVVLTSESNAGFPVLDQTLRYLPPLLGECVQAAFGLYLLLRAEPIIARCLREVRGRCASCGYDLTATSSGTCPECGTEFKPAAPVPSSSRTPSP